MNRGDGGSVAAFLDMRRPRPKRLRRLVRRSSGLGPHPMNQGHRAHPREWRPRGGCFHLAFMLLLGTCAAFLGGCLIPSQESLKKSSWPVQETSAPEPEARPPDQHLVKPVIPPETPSTTESAAARSEVPEHEASQRIAAAPQPTPPAATARPELPKGAEQSGGQAKPEANTQTKQWEDEKVKNLALELAKNSTSVTRIKVCYSVKHDEWWVIAYEDTGGPIELKQYIWSREQQRLEPFLVLKTISRDRLEEHLRTPEPDKACEVIPLPPKSP